MTRTKSPKKLLLIANILLVVGLASSSGYLFIKNRDLNDQITLTTEEKNSRLIEEINKVFKLPEDEPVVAIVTDPEEFKKQYASFTDAQSGDYLLFFRKARLNVLYRQSEKRVVTTANVNVPISVELVGDQSAIDDAEKKLSEFGNQIAISKTIKEGITQSFVFDIDNDQSAEASSVAQQLGIDVGTTLPTGITPTDQTEIIVAVSAKSSQGTTIPSEAETNPTQEP